jgi:hypothetical protein
MRQPLIDRTFTKSRMQFSKSCQPIWYLFDPSRLVPQNGIIRIGTGRDAADVSCTTIFGSVQMEQMRLFVEPVQDPDITSQDTPAYTGEAIATA